MASGGFSIRVGGRAPISSRYLLGILNSKLLFYYLKAKSNVFRGGWITCTKQYVGPLPIRVAEKMVQGRIVELVERMLELNKQKHRGTGVPPVKEHGQDAHATADLDHEIAATDAEIDNLVYELYGITDEERKIIEGESS